MTIRAAAVLCMVFSGSVLAKRGAAQAETVMITLHAKPGLEVELGRVVGRHWASVRRLGLNRGISHLTLRGTEEGNKVYLVHIFTWRDSRIPDAAPPEIQKIWTEMNALVEPRGGHAGLEITTVSVVAP